MSKEKIQRLCRRILAGFFGSMLLLTILSRTLDSLTVAKISVSYSKRDTVEYLVNGEGKVKSGDSIFIKVEPGLTVSKIQALVGQKLEPGNPLFTFLPEELEESRYKLKKEIKQKDLAMKQDEINSLPTPSMTEEELARQTLAAAQRALDLGTEKYRKAQETYTINMEELDLKYWEDQHKSEEQLIDDRERDYNKVKKAYEKTKLEYDTALRDGKRNLEDKEEKYKELKEGGASESELDAATKEVERAQEDLFSLEEQWNLTLESARNEMYDKENDFDAVRYEGKGLEQLEAAHNADIKKEEDTLEMAKTALTDLENSLADANLAIENAKVRDSNSSITQARREQVAALKKQSDLLDLEEKQLELEKIDRLIQTGGQVSTDTRGTLVKMDIAAGISTKGGEIIEIGTGDLKFEASLEKKMGEMVKNGDIIDVLINGTDKFHKAEVVSIDLLSDEKNTIIVAKLTGENIPIGVDGSFQFRIKSQIYNQVIPINALREDNRGYFCLVPEVRKTIMGEELIVVRKNLTVIEKSTKSAAVEGAISPQDKLVSDSNKILQEGDRVRMVE